MLLDKALHKYLRLKKGAKHSGLTRKMAFVEKSEIIHIDLFDYAFLTLCYNI